MSPEPIWCLLVEWLFHNTLSEIQLTSSSPSCGNIYLRRGGEFLKFLLRFCRRALPWASIWVRRGVASKFLEIEAANKLSSEILRFSSFFKVPARHGDQGSWECTMEHDRITFSYGTWWGLCCALLAKGYSTIPIVQLFFNTFQKADYRSGVLWKLRQMYPKI